MFQIAIERLARELAAVERTDYFQSTETIESILSETKFFMDKYFNSTLSDIFFS